VSQILYITSAKEVLFLAFVCLSRCAQDNSKSCGRILTKFFCKMGCVTRTNWLDFGDDPALDAAIQKFFAVSG